MRQLSLLRGSHTLVHKHDPMTSRVSALRAKHLRAWHGKLILETLDKHGPLTSEGISDLSGLDYHAVARRMGELRDAGLVIQTQHQRRNRSGRMATVWGRKT